MPGSTQPLRLVLDTNVVVAGLLWNGPPRRLMELSIHSGEGQEVEFFSSAVLLDELAHTLAYAKFASRIAGFGSSISALVAQYTSLVTLVVPASVPRVVAADADDDHVIAAAVAARAAPRARAGQGAGVCARRASVPRGQEPVSPSQDALRGAGQARRTIVQPVRVGHPRDRQAQAHGWEP
jgi:putative PIN family toxin of toxin-antitoxin system